MTTEKNEIISINTDAHAGHFHEQELIEYLPLPRHKPDNVFNYTEADLAEREVEIRKMGEIYPKIPAKWVEDIYDLLKNEPEKMDEIIKNMEDGVYVKK